MRSLPLLWSSVLVLACRRDPAPAAAPAVVARPDAPAVVAADAAVPTSEVLSVPPASLARTLYLEPFASGFDRPVALVPVPDVPGRLFVVEQTGRIQVLEGGRRGAAPALDLSARVSRGNEQGLLGLAFHPRFASTRALYVNYTDRDGDTRVVEYRLPAGSATVDLDSGREILRLEQPYSNHNGGHLAFGPDGALWIGTGDGGAAGDPEGRAQDRRSLLGKMLRIDVDAAAPRVEIAAVGLRNPWRYWFDHGGDLYLADVGQNEWESVFVVPAGTVVGRNFGWNVAEGRHCFTDPGCDRRGFIAPVADYSHAEGCSITGGVVYRGVAIPELAGAYFYADYCTALIRSFRFADGGIHDHWEWKPVLDPDGTLAQISSFGIDHTGEIYLLSLSGDVWRLAPR